MTMIDLATWLILGNFVTALGTILLIKTVIQRKELLYGYNLKGSALTFIALLLFLVGFFSAAQYVSAGFMLVTATYWGFVTVFKIKYRKSSLCVDSTKKEKESCKQ